MLARQSDPKARYSEVERLVDVTAEPSVGAVFVGGASLLPSRSPSRLTARYSGGSSR